MSVASQCEVSYGGMGRVGFIYESMKDNLRWNHLSVRSYIRIISQVGQILAMRDEDYQKAKAKHVKLSGSSIAQALIQAFGDGK